MSSGSYFTLYRKYNVQVPNDEVDALLKRYVESYKNSYSFDSKKTNEDILKTIPPVLDLSYGIKESEYDEEKQTWISHADKSIVGQRAKYHNVVMSDKTYADELLSWYFGSSFTSLREEWNLDGYSGQSTKIVPFSTAENILQACNYLLSEKWSKEFEKILANRWIKVLADSDRGSCYYKYLYRNNKKLLKDVDEEETESVEYDLKQLQNIMATYVNADTDYSYDNSTELILTYTVW